MFPAISLNEGGLKCHRERAVVVVKRAELGGAAGGVVRELPLPTRETLLCHFTSP